MMRKQIEPCCRSRRKNRLEGGSSSPRPARPGSHPPWAMAPSPPGPHEAPEGHEGEVARFHPPAMAETYIGMMSWARRPLPAWPLTGNPPHSTLIGGPGLRCRRASLNQDCTPTPGATERELEAAKRPVTSCTMGINAGCKLYVGYLPTISHGQGRLHEGGMRHFHSRKPEQPGLAVIPLLQQIAHMALEVEVGACGQDRTIRVNGQVNSWNCQHSTSNPCRTCKNQKLKISQFGSYLSQKAPHDPIHSLQNEACKPKPSNLIQD